MINKYNKLLESRKVLYSIQTQHNRLQSINTVIRLLKSNIRWLRSCDNIYNYCSEFTGKQYMRVVIIQDLKMKANIELINNCNIVKSYIIPLLVTRYTKQYSRSITELIEQYLIIPSIENYEFFERYCESDSDIEIEIDSDIYSDNDTDFEGNLNSYYTESDSD
jgi:hypothetical protein